MIRNMTKESGLDSRARAQIKDQAPEFGYYYYCKHFQ